MNIDAARAASTRVQSERARARDTAITTIRSLEHRVQEALVGDMLRGLSNLNPTGEVYQAARIAPSRYGIDGYLPEDGRAVMVIDKSGTLVLAEAGPIVVATPVVDGELMAQDLEHIARAYQVALERHVSRAEKTVKSYSRIVDLSRRLADALGFALP